MIVGLPRPDSRSSIQHSDGRCSVNSADGSTWAACRGDWITTPRESRISVQCLLLEHDVADRDRVPRGEPVPPVIVGQAELAVAGDRLDPVACKCPGAPRFVSA